MKISKRKTLAFYVCIASLAILDARTEETSQIVSPALKEYRIVRNVSEDAQRCIDCHAVESKGIVAD